jgi:hypothetical protein
MENAFCKRVFPMKNINFPYENAAFGFDFPYEKTFFP